MTESKNHSSPDSGGDSKSRDKMPEPERTASDSSQDSITAVERVLGTESARAVARAIYDEPDSETTLYRVPTLNRLFFVLSLLLLVSLILVIWQDHDRQWKQVQGSWHEALMEKHEADLNEKSAQALPRLLDLELPLRDMLENLHKDELTIPPLPEIPESQSAHVRFQAGRSRIDALVKEVNVALGGDPELKRLRRNREETLREQGLKEKVVRALTGEFQEAKYRHEQEKRRIAAALGNTQAARDEMGRLARLFNERWVQPLETEKRALERLEAAAESAEKELNERVSQRTAVVRTDDIRSIVDVVRKLDTLGQPLQQIEKELKALRARWRNWLFADFLAPTYEIEKVVVTDLHEDLNFLTVPRVDRCKTCHINIEETSNPQLIDIESKKWGSVYQNHPRPSLYVGEGSPHEYESFGCTTCHYGDGHALEFTIAAHTPSDREREEEWEEGYSWHELEHQQYPMLPQRYISSSCGKCHTSEFRIEGADKLNQGKELVRRHGCFGCHKIKGFEIASTSDGNGDSSLTFEKAGPNLKYVAEKTNLKFLSRWIRNPWEYRASTRMPRYFDVSNNRENGKMLVLSRDGTAVNELDFKVRNAVEALSLAVYLYDSSADTVARLADQRPLTHPGVKGDPKRGRRLFGSETVGCLGCHSVKTEYQNRQTPEPAWEEVKSTLAEAARMAFVESRELTATAHRLVGEARNRDDQKKAELEAKSRVLEAKARTYSALSDGYRSVSRSLEPMVRWLEKLSSHTKVETLYHESRVVLGRVEVLEQQLELTAVFVIPDDTVVLWSADPSELGKKIENERKETLRITLEAENREPDEIEAALAAVKVRSDRVLARAMALADGINDRWVHETFAPDLSRIGGKFDLTTKESRWRAEAWLATWILDPGRHDPRTVMPRLRLENDADGMQKVADIVSYLLTDSRDPVIEQETLMPEDLSKEHREVLNDIAFDYLRRNHSAVQARELVQKTGDRLKLRYVGHRLIRRYGCYGCHNGIADRDPDPTLPPPAADGIFDNAQPIGPDLTAWGGKDVADLDFGPWGHQRTTERFAIPRHRYSWAERKLQDTRRFDVIPVEKEVAEGKFEYEVTNRLIQKTPEELLKMPLFPFHDDQEMVEAAVTVVLSQVKDPIPLSKVRQLSFREEILERGGRLLEKFNCGGCHRLGARTRYLDAEELPVFNPADARQESIRWNEWEKETWLARTMTFQGRPRLKGNRAPGGVEIPAGTLLNTPVLDPTSMDPDYDPPVSVVELAKRHFDPLPGFIQDVLEVWDGLLEEYEKDPELVRFLRREREGPLARFLESSREDFEYQSNQRGIVLQSLRDGPYDEQPSLWPDVVRRDLPQWRELFRRYYGHEPHRTPRGQRLIPVHGFGEGQVRYYFDATGETRFQAPPPLVRQGERVRSEWLFHYLLDIQPLRPWLEIRMPSFRLTDDDARTIVSWFKVQIRSDLPVANERFDEDKLDRELAALGLDLFRKVEPGKEYRKECLKCHPSAATGLPTYPLLEPADRIDPREVPVTAPSDSHFLVWKEGGRAVRFEGGFKDKAAALEEGRRRFAGDAVWAVGSPWSKSEWGPDLGLTARRLRPPWVRDYLWWPSDFMPGTAMPPFFGERYWFPDWSDEQLAKRIERRQKKLEALEEKLQSENTTDEERDRLGALVDAERERVDGERKLQADRQTYERQVEGLIQYLNHMHTVSQEVESGRGEASK